MYSNPNCGHMNVKSHKMSEELEEGEIVDETEVDGGGIEQLLAEYHKQIESREELKKSKKCFICRCITAKYNCPRCGIKSCSLKCCLQHKRQFNCSGVRDRLSFVPLDKYTDIQLNSDYTFLEEANYTLEDCHRHEQNQNNLPKKEFPNVVVRFMKEAQRRNIHYRKLPPTFKKAKLNNSICNYKERTIYWDIEFIFPFCVVHEERLSEYEDEQDKLYSTVTFRQSRISERTLISELVQGLIFDNRWQSKIPDGLERQALLEANVSEYRANQEEIVVLLKHHSGRSYHQLDSSLTVEKALAHQTIVEFPTFVVILKQFVHNYNITN